MRSFSTYLNVYRDDELRNIESEVNLKIIPPAIPSSIKDDIDVARFFEGKNVYSEQINTYNHYSYKAKIHTLKKRTEQELENSIKKGLVELGYSYAKFSVKSLPERRGKNLIDENCEFEISIEIL